MSKHATKGGLTVVELAPENVTLNFTYQVGEAADGRVLGSCVVFCQNMVDPPARVVPDSDVVPIVSVHSPLLPADEQWVATVLNQPIVIATGNAESGFFGEFPVPSGGRITATTDVAPGAGKRLGVLLRFV